MQQATRTRALVIALALATMAACLFAGFNISQENSFDIPTDGVRWLEAPGGLRAERVPADSPGYRAGIRTGDILQSVNEHPTPRLAVFEREIFRGGIWSHSTYSITRPIHHADAPDTAAKLEIQVIVEPTDRSINLGLRLIAVVYLCIGLYVLFRRWTAPKSLHFFVFCLASFVLYAFRYTGELDLLDSVIFWGNAVALAVQPALFLHFAVDFSGSDDQNDRYRIRRRAIGALLYLPGAALVFLQVYAQQYWSATGELLNRLNQFFVGYQGLYYVIAAAVFVWRYVHARSPLERQQLKWLTRGTLVAFAPYTLLNVLPLIFDFQVPGLLLKLSAACLVILPLTFSWAIIRYRLMDVDLIFKRGVTYTIATAALVGLYFGVVAIVSELVRSRVPNLGVWGLMAAVIATGLVFDPLKRAVQSRVDRVFDRKRFDYRETLVDFGRSLNSQTDLNALVSSIVERLPQTLLVTRVAVFLATEDTTHSAKKRFELTASHGLTTLTPSDPAASREQQVKALRALDLGFLDFDRRDANNHLFLENPQQALTLPESQQLAAQRLDLNYYLPCRVANREGFGTRTVAIIGLGRTNDGDFLSSEDMEVLESLAGYIGIAIQNAQLYRSLQQKAAEYERLTEFHENIVESINIGIFAVDLDDRITSWNAQMESLYGRPRSEALLQPLDAIFPLEFLARYNSVRALGENGSSEADQGTHTLYKFPISLPTGETRTANIAIAPLVTRSFRTVGRIVLVDDITDRTELETQLTQSEKLSSIGLLAAGVAHEVNTPLAVISSYTQMLSKQLRDDTRLAPVLEKITQQTFRASEIVNGLLNFSRTSGSEFTAIDLNSLVHDTLVLLEHQLKTAQVKVETDLSASLPAMNGNQGKLQQVILNLMLNARDAMHGTPSARLHISTEISNSRICLRIKDSGAGIEREHLHRIFDPFFTTKVKPQPGQHKGTGLGLAVTYGIMQEHGGKISVDSEVGVGTTFTLDFPAPAATPAASQPQIATASYS
ncbi:PAS domain S-box-containing protein [Granulicella aggregans]|uniref:histidine kinase n=1 Tax=Granulicella aggregans TaxID=474949 RepID=A0A7W7ZD77_9BACT|nr:ATP-binding protein [Granulicella aggregans]MBB5057667.1 PAS domain S-box-containing protein [Granulicella aggregans]